MILKMRNRNRTKKGKTCNFGCCESYAQNEKRILRRYVRRVENREWRKEIF